MVHLLYGCWKAAPAVDWIERCWEGRRGLWQFYNAPYTRLPGADMVLSWFDAAEAKKFGASLAQFLLERVPKAAQKGDKEFAKKVDHVLEKMVIQIVQFKQHHKLNTYQKAQLGNVFKWALLDGGIAADYADEMTAWLMQKIG